MNTRRVRLTMKIIMKIHGRGVCGPLVTRRRLEHLSHTRNALDGIDNIFEKME